MAFLNTIITFLLLTRVSLCHATADINQYFTDLEDTPNPSWFSLKSTLTLGENSHGPAHGSTIQVNHDAVKVGAYAEREISRPTAIHTCTSSFVGPDRWDDQTRWYQEDGNTQIFRLFPGDDTVRNSRVNAPRSEAFGLVSWMRGDGWYEWSGRYTFLKVRPGAVLQIKHNSTYWSMQLTLEENIDGTFDLYYVKLRSSNEKALLMGDVVGKAVDVRVLDDGENHKVFVEGELLVTNKMTDRPEGEKNRARWGLYTPKSAMDRDILLFVTGVYVGPAQFENPEYAESREEIFFGDAKPEQTTFWGQVLDWLVPDAIMSWFSPDDDTAELSDNVELQKLKQELDSEPDESFLEEYYSDPTNDGQGYF